MLTRRGFLRSLLLAPVAAAVGVSVAQGVTVPLRPYFPLVDGAHQTGSLLCTKGWPPLTRVFDRADLFAIAGLRPINPATRRPVDVDKLFVATADVVSDAAGRAMVPIHPPIIALGPYQNIYGVLVNNAQIRYRWPEEPGPAAAGGR